MCLCPLKTYVSFSNSRQQNTVGLFFFFLDRLKRSQFWNCSGWMILQTKRTKQGAAILLSTCEDFRDDLLVAENWGTCHRTKCRLIKNGGWRRRSAALTVSRRSFGFGCRMVRTPVWHLVGIQILYWKLKKTNFKSKDIVTKKGQVGVSVCEGFGE